MPQKTWQKVIMNVNDELYATLKESAASHGLTIASLVRMIVMAHFKKVGM